MTLRPTSKFPLRASPSAERARDEAFWTSTEAQTLRWARAFTPGRGVAVALVPPEPDAEAGRGRLGLAY